ncbi:hypothetical protein GCM10022260_03970 [Gaetbulibacter aestuarii]
MLSVLVGCKNKEDKQEPIPKEVTEKIISEELSPQDIAKLKLTEFALDPQTKQRISDWQAYNKLDDLIINVKNADLNLFYNDDGDMETLVKNLKGNMPKNIQSEATEARVLAIETQLLKLKSIANLSTTKKPELLASIHGLLEAFYNLNFQMNAKVEADNITIEKP